MREMVAQARMPVAGEMLVEDRWRTIIDAGEGEGVRGVLGRAVERVTGEKGG